MTSLIRTRDLIALEVFYLVLVCGAGLYALNHADTPQPITLTTFIYAAVLIFGIAFLCGYFAHAAWRWRQRAQSAERQLAAQPPRGPRSLLEWKLIQTAAERDRLRRERELDIQSQNAALWERELNTLPGLDD